MKTKAEERTAFASKICNDPINSLAAMKEHLLHFEETRYEMARIADVIKNFTNFK